MPYGDIYVADSGLNKKRELIKVPREQQFITDSYGIRNNYYLDGEWAPPSYLIYKNFGFEYKASKPFSRFSRIEGGLSYNYYMKTAYEWGVNDYIESFDFSSEILPLLIIICSILSYID